jgi:subtilisin family serine protease
MLHRHRWGVVAAVVTGLVIPAATAGSVGAQEAPTADAGDVKPDGLAAPVVESTTGSYVVVMIDDPLVASIPAEQLESPAAEAAANELVASHDEVLAEEGVGEDRRIQSFTNALNGFAATLSYAEAVKVAGNPDVALVLPDELRQPTTDASGEYLGLAGRGGAWRTGLTGEGVVVGVIDSGIWPEHPSFADDGTYPDTAPLPDAVVDGVVVSSGCEFGNTAHNPADAPFECNDKLIGARQMLATYRAVIGADPDEFDSARDDDGHGSHTAATAAGNAGVEASIFGKDYGKVSGIAPRAQIIAYKALGNLGGFTSDLAAAIDQAVADGVDVINYSVGGGPALLSADAIAFLFAADAGVFVATSAGNSGDGPETIGGPADLPWITSVAASTQNRFFEGRITLRDGDYPVRPRTRNPIAWWRWWQQFKHYQRSLQVERGASITGGTGETIELVDAEDAGSDLCLRGELDPAVVEGKVVLCRRGASGRVEKGLAVLEAGGVGMILYNNTDSDNLFTDTHWLPTVHVDYTVGLEIKEYIAEADDPQAKISKTGKETSIDYDPSITMFSSRGPNPSSRDIIKPDVTAPGLQILAAASPYPDPGSVPGELFQAIAGTSMSSPHVAGLFALLKQAHPDWSAAAARSALMTTADPKVRNSDRTSIAGPFDTGSGHVAPGKPGKAGSMFDPGLVYDAGFVDYLGFLCGVGAGCFGGVAPLDPSDLNYPSIGIAELAGSQTVTRTVTNVTGSSLTWKAQVEAPAGYHVAVEPSSITLAPGESASFEVTISNAGGAVGEWSTGSLTWKSGRYEARSPIAVRGSALNAPTEVSGVGESGTTTFPIQFGYTGPYAAAPHGLVPNTPTVGEVAQDPDQTAGTEDDGAGVVAVPVDLSGVAHARWSMVRDDAVDIDLYLLGPDGSLVAQSTAGGTDELVELTLPADGTYTMLVHGWAVGDTPVEFTLDQWLVPLASGGSLAVDAAPTEAVTSGVADVSISWSGAPEGRSLGAVSHTGPDGLIGLTLVVVDNVPPEPAPT